MSKRATRETDKDDERSQTLPQGPAGRDEERRPSVSVGGRRRRIATRDSERGPGTEEAGGRGWWHRDY
jgi:hypothetical protein